MEASRPLLYLRRHWLLLVTAGFFLIVSIQYSVKLLDKAQGPRSALMRWSSQFEDLQGGVDIWARHGHPHPPIVPLLLGPLTRLSPVAGCLVWFYLKSIMALFAILWTLRAAEGAMPRRHFPLWGQVLAVACCLRVVHGDLTHGNVNLFILFLVAAGLRWHLRGWFGSAGFVVGLAAACKVTPLLFLPYFVWQRAWRAVLGCGAALVLFLVLIPSLYFGWESNLRFLASWYDYMVRPYAVDGQLAYTDHKNQSLPGLAYRLLTRSPSFTEYDWAAQRYVPLEYHNLADWEAGVVRWGLLGVFGACAVGAMWLIRRREHDACLLAEYSLVVLGMLLFSERTWKHHAVTLVLPFTLLCWSVSSGSLPTRVRPFVVAALALGLGLMLLTSVGERFTDVALAYGAWTWAFLVLLLGTAVVTRILGAQPVGEPAVLYASISCTTDALGTSGNGRPIRSYSSVSGSMPSR